MKLTSYTITLEDLKRDLEELIEIKKSVGKDALDEEDFKMAISMGNDIGDIRTWLKEENLHTYLNTLLSAWCEWEPFGEKIFDAYPDVSDILLIIDDKPGAFIEKHWLCNRLLYNPTEKK